MQIYGAANAAARSNFSGEKLLTAARSQFDHAMNRKWVIIWAAASLHWTGDTMQQEIQRDCAINQEHLKTPRYTLSLLSIRAQPFQIN